VRFWRARGRIGTLTWYPSPPYTFDLTVMAGCPDLRRFRRKTSMSGSLLKGGGVKFARHGPLYSEVLSGVAGPHQNAVTGLSGARFPGPSPHETGNGRHDAPPLPAGYILGGREGVFGQPVEGLA